jgi:hypothetical protein
MMTSTELASLTDEQIRDKARSDMNGMFLEYCQLSEKEFDALIKYVQTSSAHLLAIVGFNALEQHKGIRTFQGTYEQLCLIVGRELSYIKDVHDKGETATAEEILRAKRTDESSHH